MSAGGDDVGDVAADRVDGRKSKRRRVLPLCLSEGCTSHALWNGPKCGYCGRHGGGYRCSDEGCGSQSKRKNGKCIKHGGGDRCVEVGCDKSSTSGPGGMCRAHGGGYRCMETGCTNSARTGPNGRCYIHGGWKRCSANGCERPARTKGYCLTHNGGAPCIVTGCVNASAMVRGGACRKHGGGYRCVEPGCNKSSASAKGGRCTKHGGGPRCVEINCGKASQSGKGGRCVQHGGGQRCESAACSIYTDPAERPPARWCAPGSTMRSLCLACFISLHPAMKSMTARREQFVLAEIQRLVPSLESYFITWDCRIPGVPCPDSHKPDAVWKVNGTLLHVEVDEQGEHHEKNETRLAAILVGSECRYHRVIRINVDGMFRRTQLRDGSPVWTATTRFSERMVIVAERIEIALGKSLAGVVPTPDDAIEMMFFA